jgi:hypothetical protein
LTSARRWVTIIDFNVVELYKDLDAIKPDKQRIIFTTIALRNGKDAGTPWRVLLGMLKYYLVNSGSQDEAYVMLVESLKKLYNEETVEHIIAGR